MAGLSYGTLLTFCDSVLYMQAAYILMPEHSYSRINPQIELYALSGKLHSLQYQNWPVSFHFYYTAIIVKWSFCAVRKENVGLREVIIQLKIILKLRRRYISLGRGDVYARGSQNQKSQILLRIVKAKESTILPDFENREMLLT
jgi:hypothetical protein